MQGISWAKWIAAAALAALTPRLIVTMCEIEGIDLAARAGWTLRDGFLLVSSIGLGVTLTGGNVGLAHVVSSVEAERRRLLWCLWCVSLGMTSLLLGVDVRASLAGEDVSIAHTLATLWPLDPLDLYAAVYALAPEFLAGVLWYGAAAEAELAKRLEEARTEVQVLELERNTAQRECDSLREELTHAAQARTRSFQKKQVLERLAQGEAARDIAEALGVSRGTVYRWNRESARNNGRPVATEHVKEGAQ